LAGGERRFQGRHRGGRMVRCKDCAMCDRELSLKQGMIFCDKFDCNVSPEFFCADGKKRWISRRRPTDGRENLPAATDPHGQKRIDALCVRRTRYEALAMRRTAGTPAHAGAQHRDSSVERYACKLWTSPGRSTAGLTSTWT
jgi:hypothetical protein